MDNKKCMCCVDGKIVLKEMTPVLELLYCLWGDTYSVTEYVMENIDKVVEKCLMNRLSRRQQDIIKQRCGFQDGTQRSNEEISKIYGISLEQVENIGINARIEMRQAFRIEYIKCDKAILVENRNIKHSYSKKLLNTFVEEIERLIQYNDCENLFLQNVLKRYGVSIRSTNGDDISIDELGLSIRSRNCLERAGINTVREISALETEDLMKIRNLGRKSIEELIEKTRKYSGEYPDGFHTIGFVYDNKEIIYKYLDGDWNKIAKSIYHKIITLKSDEKTIFNNIFSPGLQEILLMKGYLYIGDIFEDAEKLIKQLDDFGFTQFADELCFMWESYKAEHKNMNVYFVDSEIAEFIVENNCISMTDFIDKAQKTNSLQIQEFIQKIEI